jgi:hypothetical protein
VQGKNVTLLPQDGGVYIAYRRTSRKSTEQTKQLSTREQKAKCELSGPRNQWVYEEQKDFGQIRNKETQAFVWDKRNLAQCRTKDSQCFCRTKEIWSKMEQRRWEVSIEQKEFGPMWNKGKENKRPSANCRGNLYY